MNAVIAHNKQVAVMAQQSFVELEGEGSID